MHPPSTSLSQRGVHVVDTGFQRPRFDAAYLLVDDGRAAFVDCGTRYSVPKLLEALAAAGLGPRDVDHLILTHVHLDHAGGAGVLMAALPEARLVAHPRGARHMVHPAALWEGARQVYGDEEMERAYGRLVGVPAERVVETHDGMTLALGRRELHFLDTPGHARHHNCIWDPGSRIAFTGDTFGLSYRELDVDGRAWVLPTTTPVQFEPEPLKASVRRVMALDPEHVCLTHFGPVVDVQRLGRLMLEQIDAMVEAALAVVAGEGRHEALKAELAGLCLRSLREHGATASDESLLDLLALDIELNAQGLGVWLDRSARPA